MSNHAFVLRGRVPKDPSELRRLLEEFCRVELHGLFQVEGDDYFEVGCPAYPDFSPIQIFLGETTDMWGPGGGKALGTEGSPVPCIELRHGLHRSRFAHWVENHLQEGLAQKVGGMCADEGVDEMWAPKNRTFQEALDWEKSQLQGKGFGPRAYIFLRNREVNSWKREHPGLKILF